MSRKMIGILLSALMVIFVMTGCGSTQTSGSSQANSDNLQKSLAVDISSLKSDDGQPLILPTEKKDIPPRPSNPEALPETDPGHWYDMEYAGWNVHKVNIPQSPKNGAIGRKIILLVSGDHPYFTAYKKGAQKIADAYHMQLKTMSANWNIDIQSQQVDQAINEQPDLIIIVPVDAKACPPLLRKINQAKIPVIASNLLPVDEGMKYVLSWTGPDDWGQMRMLAQDFAKRMNYEGGYTIVRHQPGTSPFFARTYGIITELQKIAPKMKLLDMQPTGLEAQKTMAVVSDWITRFGPQLKGIMSADDSNAQIGINEAIKKAGREDIIRVAAGNSKIGMDSITSGQLAAITYQSAEADGATPVKVAADWFDGKTVDPIVYLPKHIITKADVKKYEPAQW